jgi:subtilisin family serine protease
MLIPNLLAAVTMATTAAATYDDLLNSFDVHQPMYGDELGLPVFKAYHIRVKEDVERDANIEVPYPLAWMSGSNLRHIGEILRQDLPYPGVHWNATQNPFDPLEYTFTTTERVSYRNAWSNLYRLRTDSRINESDIIFTPGTFLPTGAPVPPLIESSDGSAAELAWTQSYRSPRWFTAAIGLTDMEGRRRSSISATGEGIRIAHLDSGITLHRDLIGHLGKSCCEPGSEPYFGVNLLDAGWPGHRRDAIDTMDDFPAGHGTGTFSVISQVAPEAKIIPIRVDKGPIILDSSNLAAGIDRAVAEGCSVISMSLGCPGSPDLEAAVKRATARGVILVAAAANAVGTVSYPGAYRDVICVTGINQRGEPWKYSSRGPEVDIAAPAEGIYHAKPVALGDATVGTEWEYSNGTSHATAITAGVAALWLQHYSRDAIKKQIAEQIPDAKEHPERYMTLAFKQALQQHGLKDFPTIFDRTKFGRGVLDVAGLLAPQLADYHFKVDTSINPNLLPLDEYGLPKKLNYQGKDTSEVSAADKLGLSGIPIEIGHILKGWPADDPEYRRWAAAKINYSLLASFFLQPEKYESRQQKFDLTILQEKQFYSFHNPYFTSKTINPQQRVNIISTVDYSSELFDNLTRNHQL